MSRAASKVLVDHLAGERTRAKDALWVVGFALVTALMAQVEVRFPFTPVPLTGQTFAVLLSGAVLGSRRGFASQLLYLSAGAAGLPVFSGGAGSVFHLAGPTGGYLWSFPLAAGLLGWLVERGAARRVWTLAPALICADLLILACGALWLGGFFEFPARQAWILGFYPFLIGDIVKVALVGVSLPRVLRHYERKP
jgi:biotin transport system substrate-specific component